MHQSKPCVLVVDADAQMRKMVSHTLASAEFKTIEAETGREAILLSGSHKPDIITIDLNLPDGGQEALKKIREWSDASVIVISENDDSDEIVEAFERGADDYMVKPLDLKVLIARIQVALKHSYQQEVGDSTLKAGDICIDLIRHEVKIGNEVVEFSPKEYDLLSFMMRHEGKMLTHRQILKEVWGDAHAYDKQYLRVYIMQVRHKIEKSPERPEYIVTEAGIGYRFDAPKKSSSQQAA